MDQYNRIDIGMGGKCYQSIHLCGQQSNVSHCLLQIVCGDEILGRTVESDAEQELSAQQRFTRWQFEWQLQWENRNARQCVILSSQIVISNFIGERISHFVVFISIFS